MTLEKLSLNMSHNVRTREDPDRFVINKDNGFTYTYCFRKDIPDKAQTVIKILKSNRIEASNGLILFPFTQYDKPFRENFATFKEAMSDDDVDLSQIVWLHQDKLEMGFDTRNLTLVQC